MSFLKNLGEKAASAAQTIGSKSQELMEIGRLKLQITQTESDIKRLKQELGEVVYNAYSKDEEFPVEQIAKIGSDITGKYAEIEETKAKIQDIQEKSGQTE